MQSCKRALYLRFLNINYTGKSCFSFTGEPRILITKWLLGLFQYWFWKEFSCNEIPLIQRKPSQTTIKQVNINVRENLCENKWKIKINTSPCMKRKMYRVYLLNLWHLVTFSAVVKAKKIFASTSFRLLFLCIKKASA